jgi:uncharacterized CHY-type Zn-finger protein
MDRCNICRKELTQEELDMYSVDECDSCQNSIYED